jgi:hypothetical protein
MLRAVRRLRVLVLPWAFVLALAWVYVRVGWPLLTGGHVLGIVAGAVLSTVLLSSALAAITVTRDVMRDA